MIYFIICMLKYMIIRIFLTNKNQRFQRDCNKNLLIRWSFNENNSILVVKCCLWILVNCWATDMVLTWGTAVEYVPSIPWKLLKTGFTIVYRALHSWQAYGQWLDVSHTGGKPVHRVNVRDDNTIVARDIMLEVIWIYCLLHDVD